MEASAFEPCWWRQGLDFFKGDLKKAAAERARAGGQQALPPIDADAVAMALEEAVFEQNSEPLDVTS